MPRASHSGLRIVSLAPSATSILCAIGARRSLVGVTKWCADVAPVNGLPKLGDCWHMASVEPILRLRPTLVIGSVPYKQETVAKLLDQRLNFLAMNPRSLGDIYADIRLLGGIAGETKQARQLVTRMQREFKRISQNARQLRAAANSRRPCKVYCEAWPNPRISSPPWVNELIEIAGGRPIAKPGAKVTDAEVAAANPDIIVLAWAAVGDRSKPQRAYSVEAWKSIPAIRNRQVHVIRDEWLNTPGPPLLHGARQLATLIHFWADRSD